MWFLRRSVTRIFFQEICSSGGKQTLHKLSAAFIVKDCHPRESLSFQKLRSLFLVAGSDLLSLFRHKSQFSIRTKISSYETIIIFWHSVLVSLANNFCRIMIYITSNMLFINLSVLIFFIQTILCQQVAEIHQNVGHFHCLARQSSPSSKGQKFTYHFQLLLYILKERQWSVKIFTFTKV